MMIHMLFLWGWTGFTGKTLWDWLQLLFVPILLAIGGAWFTNRQTRESNVENKDNQRETALQTYLDTMSELLLHEKLSISVESDAESEGVQKIARIRTLTVLPRLDGARKRNVLQFLYEAGLIETANGANDGTSGNHNPIVDLNGADFRGANLAKISLPGADLRGANFEGATFTGLADLSKVNLSKANLSKANLGKVNLSGACLSDANLTEADFTGIKSEKGFAFLLVKMFKINVFTYLSDYFVYGLGGIAVGTKKGDEYASLIAKGANLREANFTNAILHKADLQDADLEGAHLEGADFFEANLRGVSLKGADLKNANFYSADLKGANLREANIEGANILWTKLKGADVRDVKGIQQLPGPWSTLYPLGFTFPETRIKNLPPAKNKYHQFRRDTLYAKSAIGVIGAEFFLLGGVGTLVGVYTQSWVWALGTVAVLFLLAYILGYRKALTLLPYSITAIVSGMLVYGITLLLIPSHYDQAQASLLWFNTVRILTLRHQIIAGTCIGAVLSLCGLYVFNSSHEFGSFFEVELYGGGILFGIGGGIIVWLIVSSLGSIFNWGFGFGFGWNFNLLCGFLVTVIAGIGVICLLYVWMRARSSEAKGADLDDAELEAAVTPNNTLSSLLDQIKEVSEKEVRE
jgi:uncharacterized protein YjbI with pentapeptide repeats